MRTILFLTAWTLLAALPAIAQRKETPGTEIYAGASLLRNDTAPSGRELFGGWQGSVNLNIKKEIGVKFDFGGQYRSISGTFFHQHEYMLGPQLAARGDRATGFVHAVFGGVTLEGGGRSTTGFGIGAGGGLDFNVNKHFAIRAFQADYMPKRFVGNWFYDVRVSAGVVFKIRER